MKKSTKGPTWKKGMVLGQDRYFPPQELADPEAHLSEEQKKWPVVGGWDPVPADQGAPPQDAQTAEPQPKSPPSA